MRTVHANTNSRPVNVGASDRTSQSAQSSNDGGVAPIPNNQADQGPISKRIKHPHLTGK